MKLHKPKPAPGPSAPTRDQLTAKLITARAEAAHLKPGSPEYAGKHAEIDELLDQLVGH